MNLIKHFDEAVHPLENAIAVATIAHGQQKRRGGELYINHPLRVMGNVRKTGIASESWLVAAVLHDVVEDTTIDLEYINNMFGSEVAEIVSLLTHDPRMSYKEYIGQLKVSNNVAALVIKYFDSNDNSIVRTEDKVVSQTKGRSPYLGYMEIYREHLMTLGYEIVDDGTVVTPFK